MMDRLEKRYTRSAAMLERAQKTVPLGSQTFSKAHIQFPQGRAPLFLDRGKGGRVWDLDGNEYVDQICGLLPILLGYCDPDVDEAIRRQLGKGITFSLASTLEAELAERLTRIIPCAEKVRFGKNGTDATSAAIRIARAATGRERVAACGYHGWQDWYIGATVRNKGIPKSVQHLTRRFNFNDLSSLERLLGEHPGEYAAVILEPLGADLPQAGFLEGVRDLARKHGAILVFDEVITGFRAHKGGAQALFGVTPDLACFGKALGNGMPIAAIVGRADLMDEMEEIFFSSTFGGEALSLAASIAVLEKLDREPVVETLWQTGRQVRAVAQAAIDRHGLQAAFSIKGIPSWQIVIVQDHPHASKETLKTLFLQEMIANAVLTGGSHNICFAHTAADVTVIAQAYERTMAAIAAEVARPGADGRLGIPAIRPVFSVRGT